MTTSKGTTVIDWVRAAQLVAEDRSSAEIVEITGCSASDLGQRRQDPVFSRLAELERERGADRQADLRDRLSRVVTDALIDEMEGDTRNMRVVMWMADRLQILKPTVDGQMTDALQRLIAGLSPGKRDAFEGMARRGAANDDTPSRQDDPKRAA